MSEGITGFSDAVQFWKKTVYEESKGTQIEQAGKKIERPGVDKGYDSSMLAGVIQDGNERMSETNLQFSLHEDLHRTIVKVIDKETKEVIREIPPEKFMDMAAAFMKQAGLIVDETR